MALPMFASGVLFVDGNNWLLNNTNALQYKTKAYLLNVVKKCLKSSSLKKVFSRPLPRFIT
jgi:hypothetical protein